MKDGIGLGKEAGISNELDALNDAAGWLNDNT